MTYITLRIAILRLLVSFGETNAPLRMRCWRLAYKRTQNDKLLTMYFYTAFGLGIESELELPALAQGAERVDVQIRFGNVDDLTIQVTRMQGLLQIINEETYLSRQEDASYLVRNGNEILVETHAGGELSRIQVRVSTFGFGMLLQQRGFLVLHGNALAKDNRAVLFLGEAGAGKSTLTMQLVQAGYTFVADDVLAIEIDSTGVPHISPGISLLKLWPDALEQLGLPREEAPHFWKGFDKRIWSLSAPSQTSSFVLSQIYLLEQGDEIRIVPLTQQVASFYLLGARYITAPLEANKPDRTFDQCVALAKRVRISRLIRPKDFDKMNDVFGLIASDLSTLQS